MADIEEDLDRARKRKVLLVTALFLALLLSCFLSLLFGTIGPIGWGPLGGPTAKLTFETFFKTLWGEESGSRSILWDIRMPRILLAALVGAALSTSGATMQGLFRNPLADPYIVGVSSGAALGAAIWLVYGVSTYDQFSLPLLAFVGAMLTVALVYQISRAGGRIQTDTLLLAGISMAFLLSALTFYLLLSVEAGMERIVFFLMGGLNFSKWYQVWILLPMVLLGIASVFFFSRDLNAMLLGEESAQQLGVNVELVKRVSLVVAALLAAVAVAFAGIIGFVGLITPHIIRLAIGPDHRFLIPSSALAGGIFLVWADTFARTITPQGEIPIGIITAFCGTPFFIYLLKRRRYVYAA